MAKRQTVLPPYMHTSEAPELQEDALRVSSSPKAKPPAQRPARVARKNAKLVTLLLNEATAPQQSSVQHPWPDAPAQRPAPRLKKASLNVVKMGVGTGLLAIVGVQQLIQGWMHSEIWVKNALKAIGLTLLSLQLLISCIVMIGQVFQVHAEVPTVKRVYTTHKNHSAELKSQIHRISTGEDAELLARDYLDMAGKDEVLIKINTP
jgi:hypothetical protein